MTSRFYLHNKAADGQHPIYIEVRWARHAAAVPGTQPVVRMGVRETCAKKYWTKKQRISTQDAGRFTRINRKLGKLERLAEQVLEDAAQAKQRIDPAQLRATLLAEMNLLAVAAPVVMIAEPAQLTIAEVAAEWKAFYKAKYAPNYLRKVDPVAMHWEAFRPGTTLAELLPDKTTRRSELVEQWCEYLIEEAPRQDGGVGLESNTVGRYIGGLRQLLRFAGLSFDWLVDEYTYEVEVEPLLYEEVVQLYEAPMPTEYLRRVRDIFVFACFTGPRYGNLARLGLESVTAWDGAYILEYVQLKGRRNKTKVRVALDEIALEIWQRYGGKMGVPANQQINSAIKEAARLAGLNRPLLAVRQRGPHRIERRGPLWEFITCHLARHTFATMLLDGKADLGQVQNSLGHSAVQTTRRYAKSREPKRHAATLAAFQNLRGILPQSQ